MKTRSILLTGVILLVMVLSACIQPTPTPPPPTSPAPPTSPPQTEPPPPTREEPTPTSPTDTPEPSPTPTVEPPEGQRIEFPAEDGTLLVGTYFPSLVAPAPVVILMHQFGSDRGTWERKGMVAWLQIPAAAQDELWPQMSEGHSFAVFTFDFRGHGESGGDSRGERADFLMDAKAALTTVKGLPGVDPERYVLMGASIGADAAIDVCIQGCLGALSLSPGSYLEVPYEEVVTELGLDNKPAWCLAAEDDPPSADTCKSASGESYHSIIYPQGGHGEALLKPGVDPEVGQVMREFLILAFGLTP